MAPAGPQIGQFALEFNEMAAVPAMPGGEKPGKIRSEQRFFDLLASRSLRRSIDFPEARPYVPARATRPMPRAGRAFW
jgi:hypothetical protein